MGSETLFLAEEGFWADPLFPPSWEGLRGSETLFVAEDDPLFWRCQPILVGRAYSRVVWVASVRR